MQYGNFKGDKDKKINVMKILLLFHIVNYYSLVTNKFYIKPFFYILFIQNLFHPDSLNVSFMIVQSF